MFNGLVSQGDWLATARGQQRTHTLVSVGQGKIVRRRVDFVLPQPRRMVAPCGEPLRTGAGIVQLERVGGEGCGSGVVRQSTIQEQSTSQRLRTSSG